MSAANRGIIRKPYDFYATPSDVVENVLNNLDLSEYGNKVLEPSAGNGNIVQVFKEYYPNKVVTAMEIRKEEVDNLKQCADKVLIGNFLETKFDEKYDIIIGNPPYSEALEFVNKSLELLSDNGILIFLLRTAFLESKSRYKF